MAADSTGDTVFHNGRILRGFWGNQISDVWKYFKFEVDADGNYVDKSYSYCLLCDARMKYCGNTTNMGCHLDRRHVGVRVKSKKFTAKVDNVIIKQEQEDTEVSRMIEAYTRNSSQNWVPDPVKECLTAAIPVASDGLDPAVEMGIRIPHDPSGNLPSYGKNVNSESVSEMVVRIFSHFWGDSQDRVWDYFKFEVDEKGNYKDKTSVFCSLCDGSLRFSGSTSNLETHLFSEHPETHPIKSEPQEDMNSTTEEQLVKRLVRKCAQELREEAGGQFVNPQGFRKSPRVETIDRRYLKEFWGNASSMVWKYFRFAGDKFGNYIDKTTLYCTLCDGTLRYCHNTTNMAHHLERRHNVVKPRSVGVTPSKYEERDFIPRKSPSEPYVNNPFSETINRGLSCDNIVTGSDKNEADLINQHLRSKLVENTHSATAEPRGSRSQVAGQPNPKFLQASETRLSSEDLGIIWQFYKAGSSDKTGSQTPVVCKLCGMRGSFNDDGVERLLQHLKDEHKPAILKVHAGNKPETVTFVYNEARGRKRSHDCLEGPSVGRESCSTAATEIHDEVSVFARAAAEYFIADLRPLSEIESLSFRRFCKTLRPELSLLSRQEFREILEEMFEEKKKLVGEEISKTMCHSLTTESWKSDTGQTYMSIFVHYILDDWTPESRILHSFAVENRPTVDKLHDNLLALSSWSLRDTVLVVDASSEFGAVATQLGWVQLPGLNSVVDLCVSQIMALPAVHESLSKVRNLFAHMHQFAERSQVTDKQKLLNLAEKNILVEFATDWSSTVDMLMLFIEQQQLLRSLVTELKLLEEVFPSETSVSRIRDLVEILKVFKTATTYLSPEMCNTLSIILPVVLKLKACLNPDKGDNPFMLSVKQTMSKVIEDSYRKDEVGNLLKKAAALDPRTKKLSFLPETEREDILRQLREEARQLVNRQNTDMTLGFASEVMDIENIKIEKTCENGEPKSKMAKTDDMSISDWLGDIVSAPPASSSRSRVDIEMQLYQAEADIRFHENPLEWWQQRWIMYPLLSPVARRYMSIPAITTEGNLLRSGHMTHRSKLEPDTVDMQLFLKYNQDLPRH